jgi:hypothetical protein
MFAVGLCMMLPCAALAQDDEYGEPGTGLGLQRTKNVWVGISGGSLLANRISAYRYDGSDAEYDGIYDYGFDRLLLNNQIRSQISNELGLTSTDFEIGGFPERMRYKPSYTLGVNAGYYISEPFAIYAEANLSRMNLVDAITLEYQDPGSTVSEPQIEICPLTGKEQRLDLTLGGHYDFTYGEQLMFYGEFGLVMNSVRARHNEVQVRSLRYVLTSYNRNNPAVYPNVDWGGLSFGGSGGMGFRYKFNRQITFDVGGTVLVQKINLSPDIYQKWRPQYFFYLRALWL